MISEVSTYIHTKKREKQKASLIEINQVTFDFSDDISYKLYTHKAEANTETMEVLFELQLSTLLKKWHK